MVTYYAMNAGGVWSAAGTWSSIAAKDASRVSNGLVPTSAIDCVIDDYSGNLTISASSSCKSADFNGGGVYAGTLTHNNSVNWTIYGNLTLNSTMTYTIGGILSTIVFSAVTTLNTGGKTIGRINYNTAGNFTLASDLNCDNLYLSGTTTFIGAFNITTNKFIVAGAGTVTLVKNQTYTVNTLFFTTPSCSTAANVTSLVLLSSLANNDAYLTYNGLAANQYLIAGTFTDINASGGNKLYSYQTKTLTRTTNIETITIPPSGGGGGFIVL